MCLKWLNEFRSTELKGYLAEVFRRVPQNLRVWQLYGKQCHEPRLPLPGHTRAVNASTSSHYAHMNVAGEKNVINFESDRCCE
jgi:hypothetical protein